MRTPTLHRYCDGASEVLLIFMVIFQPWAFGTTERWSIHLMNTTGLVLGLLLAVKWLIRRITKYRPSRWQPDLSAVLEAEAAGARGGDMDRGEPSETFRAASRIRLLTVVMAGLTILLLAQCLCSAVNARVAYREGDGQRHIQYLEHDARLPHSYDQAATWDAFWMYLGLACVFWAARDLLTAKSGVERMFERASEAGEVEALRPMMGERTQRLIWVLALNGAWLAVVSILQRIDGTDRLLWIMERHQGYATDFSFGPYHYRGNAAQYFNLIWPVCLGYWWLYRAKSATDEPDRGKFVSGPILLFLPSAVVMGLSPIVSGYLAGAWLSLIALPLVFAVLLRLGEKRGALSDWMMILAVIIGVGGYAAWRPIQDQLPRPPRTDRLETPSRSRQFQATWQMVKETPRFGVGAAAYGSAYEFYRPESEPSYSYAHNDWLQTVAEWGWVGFGMAVVLLGCALLFPFWAGTGHRAFVGSLLIGVGVLLTNGWVDFPLQILSLLFTLLVLLAVLTSLPARRVEQESR